MSKSKKGKLRSIHASIEPMKDSKGNQGYSASVHSHFEPDGDEKQGGMAMPTSDGGEQKTFAPTRKHALKHINKHISRAMAMNEGAEPEPDEDDEPQAKLPADHPLKKLRRGY